jgi:hypothetical protein
MKNKLLKKVQKILKSYMIPPKVKLRKGVNWTDANSKNFTDEFFITLFNELDNWFDEPEVEVTSANDGVHSKHSTHGLNLAFDLETKDLKTKYLRYTIGSGAHNMALVNFAVGLANQLENYVIIAHVFDRKNHFHIQKSRANLVSPLNGNTQLSERSDKLFYYSETLPKYNNLYIK